MFTESFMIMDLDADCWMVNVYYVFYIILLFLLFMQLCIAVPCHMFKLWAFIGIMFQVNLFI